MLGSDCMYNIPLYNHHVYLAVPEIPAIFLSADPTIHQ